MASCAIPGREICRGFFNETLIHPGRKTLAEEAVYFYNRKQCSSKEKEVSYYMLECDEIKSEIK